MNGGKCRKIQNDFENYLEQIRHGGIQASINMEGRMHGDFCEFQEMTPGQQILFVINKFQTVRNMQGASNGLFGWVLALNTGLTVFMVVVLKYMLIWNLGHSMKLTHSADINQLNNSAAGTQYSEWAMFSLLDMCFSFRLFVLVICLGNVHFTSIKFNAKLSQALLQAQKITDVVDSQGMSNKYFRGRQIMTSSEANTVLAFITENSANPMAFSAAGLFCFSRNLILVIISIITTYLVFLLQV